MYNKLFDPNLQKNMTDYFANELSKLGTIKNYKKNTVIDPIESDHVFIVLSGEFTQVLIAENGDERVLFRLTRGTIFGEMDYFDMERTCALTRVIKAGSVSIISRKILDEILIKKPEVYRFFMHSITRKYRILMLQIADAKFNDALGTTANILLRIASMQEHGDLKSNTLIARKYTHEELSSTLGLSRTTITNVLNFLKEKNVINFEARQIRILDIQKLESYINKFY